MPVNFLSFGSTDSDIIEQFTATDAGSIGSLVSVGSNTTYDASGVQVGNTPTSGDSLSWDNTFITVTNDLTTGFTLQYEITKAAFDELISGQAEDRLAFLLAGTNSIDLKRDDTQDNWRVNALAGVKTVSDTYDPSVTITISYNPLISTFGHVDVYANRYPLISNDLTAVPAFDGNLHLFGDGTASFPNLLDSAKNVMLIDGATTLEGTRRFVFLTDSWGRYANYPLGGTNDSPAIQGNAVDDFSDGTTLAIERFKNRGLFANLHHKMGLNGTYPLDDKFYFFGRGGTLVSDTSSKALSDRTDTVLGENLGATWGPKPSLGQGKSTVVIFHVGTNNANSGITTEDFRTELLLEIDRMLDQGTLLVLLDEVAPRYEDSPSTAEKDKVDVDRFNGVINGLNGHRGRVHTVPLYNGWIRSYSGDDGIHPSLDGQLFWSEQIANIYEANKMSIIRYGNFTGDNTKESSNPAIVMSHRPVNVGDTTPVTVAFVPEGETHFVKQIFGSATTGTNSETSRYKVSGYESNAAGDLLNSAAKIDFVSDFLTTGNDGSILLVQSTIDLGSTVPLVGGSGGTYYIPAISVDATFNSGLVSFEGSADAGITGKDTTAPTDAGFHDIFVKNGTASRNIVLYWDIEIIESTTSPTLTTPYTNRMNISGDVVSAIDFSEGWVGASSFVITGLPNGLIATGASVAGTVVAPTGTFTTNIAATNSFGTTNAQFQWTTLTTGDPTSGINVSINKTI